jgi:hypothetical protein
MTVKNIWPLGICINLAMTGCTEIEKLKEDIEKITNQTVLSGLMIGTEDFSHPLIDSEALSFSLNESRVFLASAGVDSTDLNPSAITGATVSFESVTNGTLTYNEDAEGFYGLNSDDGLLYVDNEIVSIVFEDDAGAHSISNTLPLAANFDLPDSHAAGEDVVIDLTGQGFESYLVAVTRFPDGELVYSNEPATFQDIYDLSHAEGELTEIVIPGDSFVDEGVYAIAISALVGAETEDMVELNTILSSLLAGKVATDVICVPMCPEIPQ